jgi:hypothetical protein
MVDPATVKEELVRARLNDLGFSLEKDGFGYIVLDRREHLDMPALIYVRWVSAKGRCT